MFSGKPQSEEELSHVRTDPAWIDSRGIASRGRDCLASMGIYLFNRDVLVDVLTKTNYRDFGKEIFPASIRARHVQVYLFDGYWEDIGTIKSFYEANLEPAGKTPPFELMSAEAPLYSRARFLPPSRIDDATVRRSLIADGCIIKEGTVIENSVIGLRCRIGRDVVIRDSIIMGNDSYQTTDECDHDCSNDRPPLGIGSGTHISRAIVDKDCRIGRNVRIENTAGIDSTEETAQGMICDGIVVIPKNAVLPDGWSL